MKILIPLLLWGTCFIAAFEVVPLNSLEPETRSVASATVGTSFYYKYPAGCTVTYPRDTTFNFSGSYAYVQYVTGTTVLFIRQTSVMFTDPTTFCGVEGQVKIVGGTSMIFPINSTMTLPPHTVVRYEASYGMQLRHQWNGGENGMGVVIWPYSVGVTIITTGNGGNNGCMV
ncbi:uncharacterized protein LOC110857691 [Folsomia candida]|uniref:Uncharacterized protein n=1 Tax=Folsomia candida TaxID=158441 RepID=A0A226DHZ9_FOLCA|nr:uncharacterized protein LOC110857691 [Folsomia candida]OXA44760.1 hypothetical protein Fcan01_20756 [Folsomia candida]